jgi:hypothetical protein
MKQNCQQIDFVSPSGISSKSEALFTTWVVNNAFQKE